jgi:hypothetical protein
MVRVISIVHIIDGRWHSSSRMIDVGSMRSGGIHYRQAFPVVVPAFVVEGPHSSIRL